MWGSCLPACLLPEPLLAAVCLSIISGEADAIKANEVQDNQCWKPIGTSVKL